MKKHTNRLFSFYDEQIEKLTKLVGHYGTNKSAVLRDLIDKDFTRLRDEIPTESPESNSKDSN